MKERLSFRVVATRIALPIFTNLLTLSPALAETMSAIVNGKLAGQAEISVHGNRIEIDYQVRTNGRGPTSHEVIVLGADGLPNAWVIEGSSMAGAPTREFMARQDGVIAWRSFADEGEVKGASLYLASSASPWALGLYARAALSSKTKSVPVAPMGVLRVEDLGTIDLPVLSMNVEFKLYRLSGLWMEPRYVVLDDDLMLVAALGDGLLVRKGYEETERVILSRVREASMARYRDLQKRLAHKTDQPVQFRNVRVFDAKSGKVSESAIVTVYGERVVSILADTPESRETLSDVVVVDGQGGTLVPGLRDMHSHTTIASGLFNLAAGVTSTRDMGNQSEFISDILPLIKSGQLAGPRVTPNGFIEGASPYSASPGILAGTLDQALSAIQWYSDHGYWQIKVYNSIPGDWAKPMAAYAHSLGMGVTGHVPAFMSADQAIRDGYDEIAHISQLMLQWVVEPDEDTRTTLRMTGLNRLAHVDLDGAQVKKTVRLMKKRGVALDTTIATQERIALSRARKAHPGELPFLDHVPIDYQRYRKRDIVPTNSRDEEVEYEKAVDIMVEFIGLLHDQGIVLLPGTDDGYGFPLHRELELYVEAGLTPAEALQVNVYETAKYVGDDKKLGTIEAGKLADLVLYAGDPTTDISEVRRARLVMKGRVIYYPREIYEVLDGRPFVDKPIVIMTAAGGDATSTEEN